MWNKSILHKTFQMFLTAGAVLLLLTSGLTGEMGLPGPTEPEISTPNALKLGWRVSCQHYTLRDRGLFEAIDALADIGIMNIEPTDFQNLKNDDETVTDFRISQNKRKEWKKHLADRGMKMPSYYVSKKDDMLNRQLWDFMKDMGVEIMCGEPDPANLGTVEELCKEYGMKLAIHNHPEGHSIYWNPDTAMSLIAARGQPGPAIGFCPDLGHWARSCVDVVNGLSKYHEQAIHVLHVKDIPTACEGWKEDVPLDWGVIPFTDVFNLISAWKWQGIITIELEAIPASLENIDLCAQYIENYARTRVFSAVSAQELSVESNENEFFAPTNLTIINDNWNFIPLIGKKSLYSWAMNDYGLLGKSFVPTVYRYGMRLNNDPSQGNDTVKGPLITGRGVYESCPIEPTDELSHDWQKRDLIFNAPMEKA